MRKVLRHVSGWSGVLAVVLWVVGLVVMWGVSSSLSDSASDAEILAWIKSNTNEVLLGGWLFMLGCVAFVWFAAHLRTRFAAAGGDATAATVASAAAFITAALGMLMAAVEIDAAINKNDISAATAGALNHLSDAFFVGAELAAMAMLFAIAVLAWQTGLLPRWWGVVGALLAVVLLIGPIGWAGLIFGVPVWTLGTSAILARRAGEPRAVAAAAV